MELKVYKIDGSESGKTVTLNDNIFNVEPNDHAIWLDVKQFLANQRQGTHDTLEKSTVSGSTRKLKRQKGTGGARAGSIKSPTIRGGATVFGPHPRDYSFKLNKKIKRLARFSALTYKAKEEKILVLEDFSFDTPKTKAYLEVLKKFNLENEKVLMLVNEADKNVYLSARNVKGMNVQAAANIYAYGIMYADVLVVAESSLAVIDNVLNK